jgi:hypothetical protein
MEPEIWEQPLSTNSFSFEASLHHDGRQSFASNDGVVITLGAWQERYYGQHQQQQQQYHPFSLSGRCIVGLVPSRWRSSPIDPESSRNDVDERKRSDVVNEFELLVDPFVGHLAHKANLSAFPIEKETPMWLHETPTVGRRPKDPKKTT